MTARLSANGSPDLKGNPPVRSVAQLVRSHYTPGDRPLVEIQEGPQEHTRNGGLVVLCEAWELFGVPELLRDAGICKKAGVPAEAAAFLQTAAPLVGKGTTRDLVRVLNADPALPILSGSDRPFAKQVMHRFLEDKRFDFERLNWGRVSHLQEIEETRFSRHGFYVIDGCLLRKTSRHFEGIRILYDHVTDSHIPAYDGLSVLYTHRRLDLPVSFDLRFMTDAQYQCYKQQKAGRKSFEELLACARGASQTMPIFIRPSDYSTANLKKARDAGLDWVAQVKQSLPVIVEGESIKIATLLQRLEEAGAYVRHPELGTYAAGCSVKLPAYAGPVKLFAFRAKKKGNCRVFLTGIADLDERGFQELYHQLNEDFGEDKFVLALQRLQHLHDMGSPTHRVVFDEWFFSLNFCIQLRGIGYVWYTQAHDRHVFRIHGKELRPAEVIEAYRHRVQPLRGTAGARTLKIRANLVGFGPVQLLLVVEPGRRPRLLVTSDLKARARQIVRAYEQRWRIEVFFRTAKQDLNLEGFRARKLRAIRAHIALVLLAFTLMKLLGFIDRQLMDKSIGEMKQEIIQVIATVRILRTKHKLRLIFAKSSTLLERYHIFQIVSTREGHRLRKAGAT